MDATMSLLAALLFGGSGLTSSMRQCIRPIENQKTMTGCFDRAKALEQGMPRRHRVEDLSRHFPFLELFFKEMGCRYGTRLMEKRPNRLCVILHGQKCRGSM
jgi:hypothetical protein